MPRTEVVLFANSDGSSPFLYLKNLQPSIHILSKMSNNNKQSNAVKVLHKKFIAGSSEREAALDKERVNVKIARLIFDYREDAGLTQKQLAEMIGTTQSVISRLEDADYEGHSLTMLNKIAQALNRKLSIDMLCMKKNLNDYLQKLSPERRSKIDARAAEMLAEEMGLQELRKALKCSQRALAEKLQVQQREISKIEQRTDMYISTLRDYIEKLGGSLEITVHFRHRF